jgi:hypothetical protein
VPLPANVSVGHWAPYSKDVLHAAPSLSSSSSWDIFFSSPFFFHQTSFFFSWGISCFCFGEIFQQQKIGESVRSSAVVDSSFFYSHWNAIEQKLALNGCVCVIANEIHIKEATTSLNSSILLILLIARDLCVTMR